MWSDKIEAEIESVTVENFRFEGNDIWSDWTIK